MGRAHNAGFRVRQQDRSAVRGENAEDQAGSFAGRGVGLRTIREGFVRAQADVGMDLIERNQAVGGSAQPFAGAAAILRHGLYIVIGADAAIETFIETFGDAAFTREEGVADAGQAAEVFGLYGDKGHGPDASDCRGGLKDQKPGAEGSSGALRHIALNSVPIWSSEVRR